MHATARRAYASAGIHAAHSSGAREAALRSVSILVVLAGVTPREVVVRTKNILDDSRANIIGVVLNNATHVLPYFYDYKYYGYTAKEA